MRYYDVFNGDADGICALHQLRLADPLDSVLVTGPSRDIELLRKVPAEEGDVVTVLDISLDRNRQALIALLARGVVVRYFDHHHSGAVPRHPALTTLLDETGAMCTSALIDRHLRGRYRAWAVVGAFGDNLADAAHELAVSIELAEEKVTALRDLGFALAYNACGERDSDVISSPEEIYRVVRNFADPLELIRDEALIARLARAREADLERALGLAPLRSLAGSDSYMLPDEPWSRRVRATFANHLAACDPKRSHAVLAPSGAGEYSVSVRSPRNASPPAVELCHRFAHGGGRRDAAGIDHLEAARLDSFLDQFARASR